MKPKYKLTILAMLLLGLQANAQFTINSTDASTAASMVMGPDVIVSNASFTGDPIQMGWAYNIPTFTTNGGLILCTSDIQNLLPGSIASDPISSVNTEEDLLTIANSVPPLIGQNFTVDDVNDVAILEFDFIAPSAYMNLNFVYGSDEYLTYVNSQYNDVFAILISGPGITGPYASPPAFPDGSANLGIVPNSNPPLPITISSINNQLNSEYYIDNPGNTINTNVSLTGYTNVISAEQVLIPGATYHLKLAIADGGDAGLKSLVIMNTASFASEQLLDFCASIEEESVSQCPSENTVLHAIPSVNEGLDFGAGLSLPDNTIDCNYIQIEYDEFNSAIIEDSSDIVSIFFNAEHSFVGDLRINLICPNGSSLSIFPEESSAFALLGEPVDNELGIPGIGYDYSFSPNSNGLSWMELLGTGSGTTIPAGDYSTAGSFANLIGCPLNGVWTLEICDQAALDDGFIFDFGIIFSAATLNQNITWSTGETSPTITVSPDETTTYYLYSETNEGLCIDSVIVYVVPPVQISSDGPAILCNDDVVVLTGSGADSYLWNTGSTSSQLDVSNPGTYQVAGYIGNCVSTDSINITGTLPPFVDNFTDGDYTNNPLWTGTTDNYVVNSGVLELNDQNATAGQSVLFTSYEVPSMTNREWRILIDQNLSGSASNQSRIYFASTEPPYGYVGSGSAGVQGYFLQLGEALSNDIIRFYYDDGITTTLLASGQTSIASAFQARIKLTVDSFNNWILSADFTGGENYTEEFNVQANSITSASYFSIINSYTTSNTNNFAFDDIYIGPPTITAEEAEFCSGDTISLSFLGSLTEYYWNNGSTGSTIEITSGGDYFVAGTDENGCNFSSDIISITEYPFDNSITATDNAICDGESVILQVMPLEVIQWNNGANTPDLIVNEPGTYYAFLSNGPCEGYTPSIEITEGVTPNVAAFAVLDTLCNDGSTTLLFGTPAGGTWDGDGITNNQFSSALSGTGEFDLTYNYTNPDGCSASANETVTVIVCTDVTETETLDRYTIFPNPFNNYFQIQHPGGNHFSVELFDANGKLIYSAAARENIRIATDFIQAGMYTIRIINEHSSKTYPLVKMN